MTDDQAREIAAEAYKQAGWREEAAAFLAGLWTCHDHPVLAAIKAADAAATERAARVADYQPVFGILSEKERGHCISHGEDIATAIRNGASS